MFNKYYCLYLKLKICFLKFKHEITYFKQTAKFNLCKISLFTQKKFLGLYFLKKIFKSPRLPHKTSKILITFFFIINFITARLLLLVYFFYFFAQAQNYDSNIYTQILFQELFKWIINWYVCDLMTGCFFLNMKGFLFCKDDIDIIFKRNFWWEININGLFILKLVFRYFLFFFDYLKLFQPKQILLLFISIKMSFSDNRLIILFLYFLGFSHIYRNL